MCELVIPRSTTPSNFVTSGIYFRRVGTNSGMDCWNGTLDWTTEMGFFHFSNLYFSLTLYDV